MLLCINNLRKKYKNLAPWLPLGKGTGYGRESRLGVRLNFDSVLFGTA